MQVLSALGWEAPAAVALTAVALAFVVFWKRRQQKSWEDKILEMRRPCIHRFVRIVATFDVDGKLKERYPQCTDCGERVLKNIAFKEGS